MVKAIPQLLFSKSQVCIKSLEQEQKPKGRTEALKYFAICSKIAGSWLPFIFQAANRNMSEGDG